MTVYERPEHPDQQMKIHLAPAAAEKLGVEPTRQREAGGNAPAAGHGLGDSHRPTHASGRQGPGEKTVRWYG
jgi:hypothetical protein